MYVPARNEAEIIEQSLESILAQRSARVVTNDDASTDQTPAILDRLARAHADLTVLRGSGPQPGECGKPAALREAVRKYPAETPWLAFVDADVVLEPGALRALVEAAETSNADLVSILPRLELSTLVEQLVMPSIGALVLARYPPRRVTDPNSKTAFANGQTILIRRGIYERVGGHDSVVGEVLEDVALAERVKWGGGRLGLFDGRALAHTRMYAGWRELREGWSKNLHLLLGRSVLGSIAVAVGSLVLGWSGVASLLLGPPGWIAYAVSLGVAGLVRLRIGSRPWMALLAPLGAILTAWVITESLLRHVRRGRVRWKGREYAGG